MYQLLIYMWLYWWNHPLSEYIKHIIEKKNRHKKYKSLYNLFVSKIDSSLHKIALHGFIFISYLWNNWDLYFLEKIWTLFFCLAVHFHVKVHLQIHCKTRRFSPLLKKKHSSFIKIKIPINLRLYKYILYSQFLNVQRTNEPLTNTVLV